MSMSSSPPNPHIFSSGPGTPSGPELSLGSKLALVYLRVSTPRQAHKGGLAEGFSLPAQRAACARKADELGAVVAGEFVDAGASARSADRDGLQALLARLSDSSQLPVAYVIVHKLDRLARSRSDDVELLMAIHAAGAQLVSVSEQIDESPAGMLLHGIMASIAEFYSHNLSAEAKKGIAEKARRGGTIGYAPTGYLNITKRVTLEEVAGRSGSGADIPGRSVSREVKSVEIDPERAPHIVWAFETYASGEMSLSELTVQLAARGLTSRDSRASGGPLNRASLHRLLSNPYYAGKVRHRGVVYDGSHEPLVSEATFQAVQAMLSSKKLGGDKSWKHQQYLSGTVFCGRCRSRLGFTKAKGQRYDYFYCLGRAKKRTDCDLPYLPADSVERHVEHYWQSVALTTRQADDVRDEVRRQLSEQTKGRSRELVAAERQLSKLTRAKKRLLDAYLAEVLDVASFADKQTELKAQLHAAQSRLDSLTSDSDQQASHIDLILSVLEQAGALYLRCPPTARQQLNQAMFARLFIDTNGVQEAEGDQIVANVHEIAKGGADAQNAGETTNPAHPCGRTGFERELIGGGGGI